MYVAICEYDLENPSSIVNKSENNNIIIDNVLIHLKFMKYKS